ncbi:MAG: ABC transporter permease [Treponema sp.]|nr:ABC transporter permease [Treponema sp.]
MYKYVIKRLLIALPTIFGVMILVFTILNFMPGDPGRIILGAEATPESVAMFNAEFGLDQPFFTRLSDFLVGVFTRFDFGVSFRTRQPVIDELVIRLPITARIAAFAVLVSVLIGVPLGVLSAVRRSTVTDRSLTVIAMFLTSIPGFVFGLLLIYVFALRLGWLPTFGSRTWQHYILPVATLGVLSAGGFLRFTRVIMLETVNQEYIKTARAKGAAEPRVIWKHAFKNACLPLINSTMLMFSGLLGGAIITETIFSINGIGLTILRAVQNRDLPVVTAGAILLATFFLIIVLVIDLLYAYIDPKIRARFSSS